MQKNIFFSYVFYKLNNCLEIRKKSTEIHAFLRKLLTFAQKSCLWENEKSAFVRMKKKIIFWRPRIQERKKYVFPKIVQRTIPESYNAKQIFDQNGLCDLRWFDPYAKRNSAFTWSKNIIILFLSCITNRIKTAIQI